MPRFSSSSSHSSVLFGLGGHTSITGAASYQAAAVNGNSTTGTHSHTTTSSGGGSLPGGMHFFIFAYAHARASFQAVAVNGNSTTGTRSRTTTSSGGGRVCLSSYLLTCPHTRLLITHSHTHHTPPAAAAAVFCSVLVVF